MQKRLMKSIWALYGSSAWCKRNKLLESGAITGNAELRNLFANQTGSYFGTIPFYGNLDQTEPDNYDGATDITADTTITYQQGVFVYGRAKAWTEKISLMILLVVLISWLMCVIN